MSNFTLSKLKCLFNLIMMPLYDLSNKRDQNFRDTPLDVMFLLFPVLKSDCTWHLGAAMFRRKTSSFEKTLLTIVNTVL